MRYFADYIKGKPYQRTVLWENSSPSSNFLAQTITLSDNVTDYDEIQIISYNTTTDTNTRTTTLVKSDLLKATEFAINDYITSAGASFNRYVTKQSNTSFLISTAYRWNTSGTTNNSYIIPIKIIGIKKGIIYGEGTKTQEKTATPYITQQVVIPDDGYTLSQVTIEAIAYDETDNIAGGKTTSIGTVAPTS